jgi:hypothetical protein
MPWLVLPWQAVQTPKKLDDLLYAHWPWTCQGHVVQMQSTAHHRLLYRLTVFGQHHLQNHHYVYGYVYQSDAECPETEQKLRPERQSKPFGELALETELVGLQRDHFQQTDHPHYYHQRKKTISSPYDGFHYWYHHRLLCFGKVVASHAPEWMMSDVIAKVWHCSFCSSR